MTPRTPITGDEVADVLERAADLIAKPGAWCDWPWALDAGGDQLFWGSDKSAVSWCLLGALEHVTGRTLNSIDTLYHAAYSALEPFCSPSVVRFNGFGSQQQSVAALRSAATAARQQGEGK